MQPARPGVQSEHDAGQIPDLVQRSARAFNRACQLSGMTSVGLCRRLAPMIGRETSLSRQTLAAWRKGRHMVPMAAFLAACELAGLRPPMVFSLAAEDSPQQ